MNTHHPVTCKNCGNHFSGNYCNACGEKVYGPKDKSIWHLLEEGVHFVSHFEGKLLVTVKAMALYPGKFALDYCGGIRRKYFKPMSFFLLVVVLYLLFPFAKGLNLSIGDHTHSWYGNQARQTALHYMAEHRIDEQELVARYDDSSEKVSKVLLFLLIPVMAGMSSLLTIKQKKLFFEHLIFSVETISFFVIWGFLIVPLLLKLAGVLVDIPEQTDLYTLPIIITGSLRYIFLAAKRFYTLSKTGAMVFSALFLAVLLLFAHYVYSAILFFVTINVLH